MGIFKYTNDSAMKPKVKKYRNNTQISKEQLNIDLIVMIKAYRKNVTYTPHI